jgi:hypothetical protein
VKRSQKQKRQPRRFGPPPPKHLEKALEASAGRGLSQSISDNAFWLDDDDRNRPWYEAFAAIDRKRNKQPLLDLLRSKKPTEVACWHLADLLDRHQLRKKRGAQTTPAYDRTPREAFLEMAIVAVRDRNKGVSVKDAIAEAAKRYYLSENEISDAYHGRSSIRRVRKRQYRPRT